MVALIQIIMVLNHLNNNNNNNLSPNRIKIAKLNYSLKCLMHFTIKTNEAINEFEGKTKTQRLFRSLISLYL